MLMIREGAESCLQNVRGRRNLRRHILPALAFKVAKKKNACMPLKLTIVSKFLLLLMVPAPSSDCIFSCCPLVSSWHTSGWHNLPLTLSPSLYPSPVPDLYLPCGFVDSSSVTSFSRHHPGKPPVFSDVWKKRRHFNSLKCL